MPLSRAKLIVDEQSAIGSGRSSTPAQAGKAASEPDAWIRGSVGKFGHIDRSNCAYSRCLISSDSRAQQVRDSDSRDDQDEGEERERSVSHDESGRSHAIALELPIALLDLGAGDVSENYSGNSGKKKD